jgi:hypothetical protein
MGRLLNSGFPLGVALELAREESVVGSQYLVVGDSGLAVAQARNGSPNLCEIERVGDSFELEFNTYPTSEHGMGSMTIPFLKDSSAYSLSSGNSREFRVSDDELKQFLSLEDSPLLVDNELCWWSEVDIGDL